MYHEFECGCKDVQILIRYTDEELEKMEKEFGKFLSNLK
jgi:hypothetical protein